MKKIFINLILFAFLFINQFLSQTSPFVKGVSPSPILKGIEFVCEVTNPYDNSWSDSIPDLYEEGVFIQDTLELVYDSSYTGNNPAYSDPHLLANEGCLDANGQPYIQSSLNGKIAVLYRGSCQFGIKTWLAENNGAEAVLLINHTANDIPPAMAGGDSGNVVNIPIISLTYEDGNYLLKQMEKGPVVVRIGNDKSNLSYDIMTKNSRCLGPPLRTMPYNSFFEYMNSFYTVIESISITNTGSQDIDIKYWNILEDQSSVIAHSTKINEMVGYNDYILLLGLQTDSIPLPDPSSSQQLPQGQHTFTTVLESNLDQDTTNNKASFPIFFNNVASLARSEPSNGEIIANFYPSEHDSSYISCMYLDPNSAPQGDPQGVYFSISKDDGLVGGEQIELEIYNDLSSSPIFNDTYTCPSDTLNKKIIYHPISSQTTIEGYVCLKTESPSVKFGYDSVPNYLSDYVYDIDNQMFLLGGGMDRRFNPVQIDGVWDEFFGWGRVKALSLGIKYILSSPQNIAENKAIKTELFPNPTKDIVTISIADFSGNIFTEVYDIVGNKLQSTSETSINLGDYANGIYLLKVAYGNRVEEIKVIKD